MLKKELPTHQGKVAVVTGARRGIGQAIARRLAARGASLVLVDLDDCSETRADLQTIDAPCIGVRADVSRFGPWEEIARKAMDAFGRVDIVVNNAGIYPVADIEDLSYELWSKVFQINLDSMFYSAKVFVPIMRRNKWGRFVNVSSNSLGTNFPGLSHYMASKMGVIGFTRGLANDVGPHGITVNAIGPALTQTPGMAESGIPNEAMAAVTALQANPKVAYAEDIVGPVLFLTSDDGQFVTGHTIMVDGGMYKL